MLPSFAKRCRDWEHKRSCRFNQGMACAAKDENDIFCGCGQGQLSLDFIEDVPMWSSVVDFTARAAKPPIFSVPLVDPPFDGWSKDESSPSRGCVACGNIEASSGGKLLECSACYGAKYCSTKCQREDWRNHKRHCGRQSKQVLI
jgi:hypothetical protein